MYPNKYYYIGLISLVLLFLFPTFLFAATAEHSSFPLPLDSYKDEGLALLDILKHRIEVDPFNLVASLIFQLYTPLQLIKLLNFPIFWKFVTELPKNGKIWRSNFISCKGVYNCTKKNKRSNKIKRIYFNSVFKDI